LGSSFFFSSFSSLPSSVSDLSSSVFYYEAACSSFFGYFCSSSLELSSRLERFKNFSNPGGTFCSPFLSYFGCFSPFSENAK
jgi:hypothetical protein